MVTRSMTIHPKLVIIPVDAEMRVMSGRDLMERLTTTDDRHPAIMVTGHGDLPIAVHVTKANEKHLPEEAFSHQELLANVEHAPRETPAGNNGGVADDKIAPHFGGLTVRQREVLGLVLAGQRNKDIAAILGISQRTVENHRARIMRKTGSKSLAALVRLALEAA